MIRPVRVLLSLVIRRPAAAWRTARADSDGKPRLVLEATIPLDRAAPKQQPHGGTQRILCANDPPLRASFAAMLAENKMAPGQLGFSTGTLPQVKRSSRSVD